MSKTDKFVTGVSNLADLIKKPIEVPEWISTLIDPKKKEEEQETGSNTIFGEVKTASRAGDSV